MAIPILPLKLEFDALLAEVRACRACAPHLPFAPRPILSVQPSARILVVGQAPGTRVHETGIPWNDPSGDRLRLWMGLAREVFYDATRIAIIPMGFCYPGRGRAGDLPPRPECASLWFEKLHAYLPHIELTLLLGQYAQRYYLKGQCKDTLTHTVRAWQEYAPRYLPLPHPSPRNNIWLKKNPWFEAQVVPLLREQVQRVLA